MSGERDDDGSVEELLVVVNTALANLEQQLDIIAPHRAALTWDIETYDYPETQLPESHDDLFEIAVTSDAHGVSSECLSIALEKPLDTPRTSP